MNTMTQPTLSSSARPAEFPLLRVIIGTALSIAVLMAALFFCWGRGPVIAAIPWFVPLIQGFMALAAFCVAFIAFGRCRVLRDAVSYWIGIAFTSSFICISFYILTWPGLSSNGHGLIARLPGTAAWIITSMQVIFGALILVALLAPWPRPQAFAGNRWFWSIAVWASGICALNLLFVVFEARLPAFVGPSGAFTPLLLAFEVGLVFLFTFGSVLAVRGYRRTGDRLLAYIALLMVLWAFSQLAVFMGGERYDLWWYLARLLANGGYLALLFGMLADYVRLYRNERARNRALELSISKRQRAEEALRTTLESIGDGFFACDSDWRFVYVNAPAERILGIRRAEVLDKSHWEVFPLTLGTKLEAEYRRAAAGEVRDFENYYVPWHRWFHNRCFPREGGGMSVYFEDITERKLAEVELQELTQRLTYHVDNSPLAVIEWGPDMRLTRWSGTAEHIFGWTAAEVLGKQMEDFRWIYQDDAAQVAEVSDELQTGADTHRFSANRNYRKDGSVVSCEWYNSSLLDASGNLRSILSLVLDITERTQAEAALQASLHEKEVLLKEIHHRVKNNMQVISSLVSLQADTLDNPALCPLFNDLRDRVRTMALVHEKLYQSENLADIDFAEYTHSLLSYLWRAHGAAAAAIRLSLDVQPVALSVEAAVPCGLILNELVTNALKHAFRDRADGELSVALHADPHGTVCLSVRDNGVGLPADWRQAPSLGLKLVQTLATQVHGTLDVRAADGTAFTLAFAPPMAPRLGGDGHA